MFVSSSASVSAQAQAPASHSALAYDLVFSFAPAFDTAASTFTSQIATASIYSDSKKFSCVCSQDRQHEEVVCFEQKCLCAALRRRKKIHYQQLKSMLTFVCCCRRCCCFYFCQIVELSRVVVLRCKALR